MYTEIYLRLEPLGVELVAQAARRAGHNVRILDLQVFSHKDYFKALDEWHPDAVCFGLNYLANIPEVIDLAKETKQQPPYSFFFVGGHSASFTAFTSSLVFYGIFSYHKKHYTKFISLDPWR